MSSDAPALSQSEPVFNTAGNGGFGGPNGGERPRSLHERRSGSLQGLPGLSVETLANNRDASDAEDRPAKFRSWTATTEGKSIPTQLPGSLVIMSYNILAQRYISTDRYPFCNPSLFETAFRCRCIYDEISGCEPDIICFQEMSIEVHTEASLLGDALRREKGYASKHLVVTGKDGKDIHRRRADDGTLMNELRTEFEGVAIFYNPSRFTLLEEHPIRFNNIAVVDRDLLADEKQRVQVQSHNVSNVLVLQDNAASVKTIYVIGTVHSIWDGSKPECQVYQMYHLVNAIEEIRSGYDDGASRIASIICGDFNSELSGASMRYALDQRLHSSFFSSWSRVNPRVHTIPFRSAYEEYVAHHPHRVTAMNPSTNGEGKVIDHILYDAEELVCCMVGKLGERQEIPRPGVPSDHYPVAASFVPKWAVTR